MKLIYPKVEILEQGSGIQGIYDQIEKVSRVCYKSAKKDDRTSKDFTDALIRRGHLAMLEHGTVYMAAFNEGNYRKVDYTKFVEKYDRNPYSKVRTLKSVDSGFNVIETAYVTTNMRVLHENGWMDDYTSYGIDRNHEPFLCPERYSVLITTDRGVTHELVRQRHFSFAQESTRYCNYSNDKFGHSITFIIPSWAEHMTPREIMYDEEFKGIGYSPKEIEFCKACQKSEEEYFNMIAIGAQPQEARQVLPNAVKSDIVITGFADDWIHFFNLRLRGTTGAPHPDMKNVAGLIHEAFQDRFDVSL